jgi:ring-1,2-phenylacetyl-CoA epoxidase subunit PaaE
MARFHTLRVTAVDRLTDDSVALTLGVPPELREEYRHTAGQHLALRRAVDGTEIRRTYSICSPAPAPAATARAPCGSGCGWSRAARSRRTR